MSINLWRIGQAVFFAGMAISMVVSRADIMAQSRFEHPRDTLIAVVGAGFGMAAAGLIVMATGLAYSFREK